MLNRGETERVQRLYDEAAGKYDRFIGVPERALFGDGRRWVCSQAHGEVLEIAVGTGRNLPCYPADTRVTGIDLCSAWPASGRGNGAGRSTSASVMPRLLTSGMSGSTRSSPLSPSAPSPILAKPWRRPGGCCVPGGDCLLEHVRSPRRAVRMAQRLLDPLTVRFQGDHLLRGPLEYAQAEGFDIDQLERSKWGIAERLVARKPG